MVAKRKAVRRGLSSLGAALSLVTLSGCSPATSPSATAAIVSSGEPGASQASAQPFPDLGSLDFSAIVIPPEAPPRGMTASDDGEGPAVLEQLPLSPDTAADLLDAPGFVSGRWSRFAGSEQDLAASRGFILTWVVRYATERQAGTVASILLNELQSPNHYGWGVGGDAGLGDEGTCLEGDNPQIGGLHETICVWRRGRLVMVVGGGSNNQTPIHMEAEAMDARAQTLDP